ncbi:MAG: glycosyltransferase 87 family protein [Cyclobacteriaceae bacterium]
MREKYPLGFYSIAFILLLSVFSIGNLIERHQSLALLLAFISAFTAFFLLVQEKSSVKLLIGIGILSRIVLFFSMPSLSDDIYRFIWDGTLLNNGTHPFDQLPAFYLDKNIPGITQELFNQLNSPDYFTIYPPLNQLVFWLSTLTGSGNWLVSANTIRTLLLLADIGSLWVLIKLLKKFGKSLHLAFLFFLNPLVILEFTGNLHFEGLVIFFLLTGIYFFETSRKFLSGINLGLAIGTKLLPLIFLPYLFLRGIKTKKWLISIIAGLVAVFSLVPMLSDSFISGMQSSLSLYFQKFEFNASIYFLAREIGYWIYGYNKIAQIGPILSLVSIISILTISIIGVVKKWSLPKTFLFILSVYLLFATTVHPWYILPLVVFGILSGYNFPIVWSFMITVTYFGYSQSGYELPTGWVIAEYLVVGFILFLELKRKKVIINPI